MCVCVCGGGGGGALKHTTKNIRERNYLILKKIHARRVAPKNISALAPQKINARELLTKKH